MLVYIYIATVISGYKDINCYNDFEDLKVMKKTIGQYLRELKLSRKGQIYCILTKK